MLRKLDQVGLNPKNRTVGKRVLLENGFEVSFGAAGGGGFQEVTLNVCSNGTPDTITVLAKA